MYRDSKAVDVLIFVEHRDRELEVVSEIARTLKEAHGLSVAIASAIYHPMLAAALLRPKVVVSTSLAQGPGFVTSLFQRIYKDRVTYVYLNWEQVLSPLNVEYRRPRDYTTLNIAKHFAWGREFKEFLVASRVKEENIFVTGKPSLNVLQRKASRDRSALKDAAAAQFGLDASKRWLFVPLTDHFAFFSEYHIKSRVGIGSDEQTVATHRKYVNDTVNTIFRWIHDWRAQAEATGSTIVMRPHPSVSKEQYVERFTELVGGVPPHVHISKAMNAHDWLVISDGCYTNYSSLALDGNCIGVPSYLVEPEPFPAFLEASWFEGLARVRTQEEFNAALHHPAPTPRTPALDFHVDTSLDPIPETARHLARFARQTPGAPWTLGGFIAGVNTAPRRVIGSALRWTAHVAGFPQMVRRGLLPDWFSAEDVRQLLSEPPSPGRKPGSVSP